MPRRKGTVNQKTRVYRERVMRSGETPLEFMLRVMRDKDSAPSVKRDMAKAAAPYVHPKLQAIQHAGNIDISLGDMLDAAFKRVKEE